MKVTDIKAGDTLEYDYVLDHARGSYKTRRGVVIQRKGRNIEIDCGGVTDWLYWPTIRHYNPRIVSGDEAKQDSVCETKG